MQSAWHVFDPACSLLGSPPRTGRSGDAKSIFITENGCGASDVMADDGKVYDSDRIMFLRAYPTQLQRATADGVPVHGYFLWSAQNNFGWIDGYGNRVGLICVDFKTQKRLPKLSAQWFRETARRKAVV
jgi:beta-glucosidase